MHTTQRLEGVENSIRNLVKVAAALNRETTIVCREPINDEVLDVNATIPSEKCQIEDISR